MSGNQEDSSTEKALLASAFRRTRSDAAHTGIKLALSTLPLAGEIFALLIAAPASKRRDAFLITLYEALKKLEEKYEGFSIETLTENEVFQTTVIQAVQAAVRTHSKEKHEALKNAVLNSAISKTPDENRQAMFIRLCDELTETHIHLLKFFDSELSPSIDLDDSVWRMNMALSELGEQIEAHYPYLANQFSFYIEVINDLHKQGLIVNLMPSKDMLTSISHHPISSTFAKEFLDFIKSPLD